MLHTKRNGFSDALRSALNAKIGHHLADELERSITMTAGAVASQNGYQQQATKMVELASRLDQALVRIERLERANKEPSK